MIYLILQHAGRAKPAGLHMRSPAHTPHDTRILSAKQTHYAFMRNKLLPSER